MNTNHNSLAKLRSYCPLLFYTYILSGIYYYFYFFIVTPIVGVCKCSMFCCMLLYIHSSIAIILMGIEIAGCFA